MKYIYAKSILVRFKDIFLREPKLIMKYYRPFFSQVKNPKEGYIFMVDGKFGHGGMFDRLKGIISAYAISKVQQKYFYINFCYPFELQKYLEPNEYNWLIDKNDIVYSYPYSRPLFLYGECYHPTRLLKKRTGQAHFYYGYNSLGVINMKYGTDFEWGKLYRELFKPTPYLQQYIDYYQNEIGRDYMVIHTRFLNLLGDKVETAINPELPVDGKAILMKQILRKVEELSAHCEMRILLASDSMIFIEYMKREKPDIYVVPGQVKHIDTAGETSDAENIKMFVDYYLISGAKKVYNIVGEGMWPSAFPEYAAKIGGTSFKRVLV